MKLGIFKLFIINMSMLLKCSPILGKLDQFAIKSSTERGNNRNREAVQSSTVQRGQCCLKTKYLKTNAAGQSVYHYD